jgi:hypothetical protein
MSYVLDNINDGILQLIKALQLSLGSLPDAYYYLGVLYDRTQQYALARHQWHTVVISIDSTNDRCRLSLVLSYMADQDYNTAADYLLPLLPTMNQHTATHTVNDSFHWLTVKDRRAVYWLAEQINALEDDDSQPSASATDRSEL